MSMKSNNQKNGLKNSHFQLEATTMLLEDQLLSEALLLSSLAERFEMTEDDLLNLLSSLGLTLESLKALDAGQLALLQDLLSLMRNDLSLTDFLNNLDEAGFLYECAGCKRLHLSSKLLLDEQSLVHTCKEYVGYSKTFGQFKLIAAGPADRLRLWAHSKMLGLDRPFAGP